MQNLHRQGCSSLGSRFLGAEPMSVGMRNHRPPRLGEPGFWKRPDVRLLAVLSTVFGVCVVAVTLSIKYPGGLIEDMAIGVVLIVGMPVVVLIVAAGWVHPFVMVAEGVRRTRKDTLVHEPSPEAGPFLPSRPRRSARHYAGLVSVAAGLGLIALEVALHLWG